MASGYPDGTFKPNNKVTEAEFLKLFISAFHPAELDKMKDGKNWSDKYYDFAVLNNYPVSGAQVEYRRNLPITRVRVAEIVAGAAGVNYSGNNAIQYLLGNKLANGKTGATIAGYQGADPLTRAEAVQFIKNAMEHGLTQLKARPTTPSPVSELPALPQAPSATGKYASVVNYMNNVLASGNYPGYTVFTKGNDVDILKDGDVVIMFSYASRPGYNNLLNLYDAETDSSVQLTLELLRAVGVKVNNNFASVIRDVAQSGKEVKGTFGGKTLTVGPNYAPGQVDIYFK